MFYCKGGLGEAVASVLTERLRRMLEIVILAVREIPCSSPGGVLLYMHGTSARWTQEYAIGIVQTTT